MMVLSGYAWSCWGDPFRGDAGLYRTNLIGWIVLVSAWVCLEKLNFYALADMKKLACYWLNGKNRPDGTGMGRGWYGGTDVIRRQNRSTTIGS